MKRERRRARPATASTRPTRPQRPQRPQPPAPSRPRREARVLAAIGLPILAVAVLAAALIGGGATAPAATTLPPAAGSGAPDSGLVARLVYPDSPTLGPETAPVTLVEFLDPECESCRAAYPFVKNLLAEYAGKVRLVVRYVPGHGNSALAAVAIEEAGRQGRYWEALELFFDRQPEWGEQQEPQTEAFVRYAGELGLDVDRLRAALASPDLTKIERDAADGRALGIRGTPTFFVNGTMVEELSEQALRTAIDGALDG